MKDLSQISHLRYLTQNAASSAYSTAASRDGGISNRRLKKFAALADGSKQRVGILDIAAAKRLASRTDAWDEEVFPIGYVDILPNPSRWETRAAAPGHYDVVNMVDALEKQYQAEHRLIGGPVTAALNVFYRD